MQVASHFGRDGGRFEFATFGFPLADRLRGAAAVPAEGRPVFVVVGEEYGTVQIIVAGPCFLIADSRVFPVRKVVLDFLQPGELRAAVCELRFGPVDGLQAVGLELCYAEGVKLFVDLFFPVLEALPFGKAFFKALFQCLVDAVVFDVGGGEGFEGVKGCGFAVAGADYRDVYACELSVEVYVWIARGCGFEAFSCEFVEFRYAVRCCGVEVFE